MASAEQLTLPVVNILPTVPALSRQTTRLLLLGMQEETQRDLADLVEHREELDFFYEDQSRSGSRSILDAPTAVTILIRRMLDVHLIFDRETTLELVSKNTKFEDWPQPSDTPVHSTIFFSRPELVSLRVERMQHFLERAEIFGGFVLHPSISPWHATEPAQGKRNAS